MSFSRDTAKSSVQKAIYDLVKYGLGAVWLSYGPSLLSGFGQSRVGMSAGSAVAWGLVLVLVLPFVGLFLWDWWSRSRAPKRVNDPGRSAMNSLERYYMLLVELREHV